MTDETHPSSAPALFDRFRAGPQQESGDDKISDDIPAQDRPGAEASLRDAPGHLSADARRGLVSLLRHGVVLAHNKQHLFDILVREQASIQHHLADMFLRLLIDEANGVAVLLQQQTDDEDAVSLISRRPLSLYDTLLLLVLRKHFQERETAGEQRIYIDIDRIESRLTPFLPLTKSSRSDRRKLNGALKSMKDKRLLQSVPGDDERFEITPVVRYVVDAEFLQQMLNQYQAMAEQAGIDVGV